MDDPGTDLAYYQARAAVELGHALGAAHPKASDAHHVLALRYLNLAEQLAHAREAEPEQA